MEFIGIDVFQYNIHHFMPGFGNSFWVRIAINKILKQPGNHCIVDLNNIRDYYELKKQFNNLYVIEITDPCLSKINSEYIPSDQIIIKKSTHK
jgi:hypothetical protein